MNRLAEAASPYLLQHRDNPVDWWEWGADAFAEAKRSNRPILLSIGYAACHWCHVMAHESFENPATAAVMNELFVNIKVDREERPDIDHVYMSALHSLGEQGGWPLTMFLTPDGDPFWGGTYFPPEPRHGRPSFTGVLRQLATIHRQEPERIAQNAQAIRNALVRLETIALADAGEPNLDHLASQIAGAFDPIDGGLRGAPKFPNAGLIELLWRRGSQNPAAAGSLDAATLTLHRMARGGIHDHLGGGFARYAVDERWLVPHFEKMLYDNAQLLGLYALEARRSDDPLAQEAAKGIATWLEREMLLPEGAFAASLDADSEGVEGKYYVWTYPEVEALLGPTDAALLARHYDVSSHGNWEDVNILNRLDTPDPDEETSKQLARLRTHLLTQRSARTAPARDDKILADWNGLMIAALTRAAGLLDQPHWQELAARAYRFVAESMADGEGLAHSHRAGRSIRPGFALDHAAMVDAALALHDATFDPRYLGDARRWSEHLWRNYRDPESGLIGMTRLESGELPVVPRPSHDDAVPNALGVHAANLVRIARKTGMGDDRDRAAELMKAALAAAARAPMAHGSILNAYDLERNGVEIVLAGPKRATLHAAARRLPYTSVILVDGATEGSLPAGHPAAAILAHAGEGAAFICFEGRCLPPVTDPNRLAEAIAAGR